jgi:beta-lactamase superfamily II metal-dependent hydrolase
VSPARAATPPRLTIVDVGHGNSAVLRDGRSVTVIDAGPGSSLLEFLTAEGIREIDVVLLSHADKDHIQGLIGLLTSGIVTIGLVRLNSDAAKGSRLWDDLAYALDDAQRDGKLRFEVSLTDAHTGQLDTPSVRIEILAPSAYLATRGPGSTDRHGRPLTSNSTSAVIRLLSKRKRPIAILMGDLDEVGFLNLSERGHDVKAPVLVFPHHGGHSDAAQDMAFAEKIVSAVDPQTVVFSIGRGYYDTPLPEVITGVRRGAPSARIVCTQLSERCAIRPPSHAKHLTSAFARGRDDRHCCGGSIVVSAAGAVTPNAAKHRAFIAAAAPTALCTALCVTVPIRATTPKGARTGAPRPRKRARKRAP